MTHALTDPNVRFAYEFGEIATKAKCALDYFLRRGSLPISDRHSIVRARRFLHKVVGKLEETAEIPPEFRDDKVVLLQVQFLAADAWKQMRLTHDNESMLVLCQNYLQQLQRVLIEGSNVDRVLLSEIKEFFGKIAARTLVVTTNATESQFV